MKFVQSGGVWLGRPAKIDSAPASSVGSPKDRFLSLLYREHDKILFLSSTYCVPSRFDIVRAVFLAVLKALFIHAGISDLFAFFGS